MESMDPGIMMPESGRALTHQEAVEMVREWITQLPN
jgi:predicted transcriptional regulator